MSDQWTDTCLWAMWPGRHPFTLAVRATLKRFRRCQLAVTLFPFTVCIVTYLLIGLYPRDEIIDWRVHRMGVVVRCHACQHTATAHHGTANLYVRLQQTQTCIAYSTPQSVADRQWVLQTGCNHFLPSPYLQDTQSKLAISLDATQFTV
jgi:hypothetical protein